MIYILVRMVNTNKGSIPLYCTTIGSVTNIFENAAGYDGWYEANEMAVQYGFDVADYDFYYCLNHENKLGANKI